MSEIVGRMEKIRSDADVALSEGNYAIARELYTRLMALVESGAVEQEKDTHRFRMGDIEKALRNIERLEIQASGAGKYRRIPVTTGRPDFDEDCYR